MNGHLHKSLLKVKHRLVHNNHVCGYACQWTTTECVCLFMSVGVCVCAHVCLYVCLEGLVKYSRG